MEGDPGTWYMCEKSLVSGLSKFCRMTHKQIAALKLLLILYV